MISDIKAEFLNSNVVTKRYDNRTATFCWSAWLALRFTVTGRTYDNGFEFRNCTKVYIENYSFDRFQV